MEELINDVMRQITDEQVQKMEASLNEAALQAYAAGRRKFVMIAYDTAEN